MMDILTRTEEIILLAIYRLGDNAYGVTIREEVEALVGKSYSVGAIYVPLERMTKRGLLVTRAGTPTLLASSAIAAEYCSALPTI